MKQTTAPEIKNGNGLLELLEKAGKGYWNAEYRVRKALRALSVSLGEITKDPLDTDEMEEIEEGQKALDIAYKARRKSHIAFQDARSRTA
ncbi:MAG: hypothetical protein U9M90_02080 [Patescibacteria group bacterium]|nr:hypothetical protein [Patescibacteria group bacterium]